MINRLVRLFIQDCDNVTDPAVREKYGVLSGAVGIVLNLLLSAGKFFAGVVTGSIAITADAFNNLSDAGSSVVTLFIAMGMVSGIQKRSLPDWLR